MKADSNSRVDPALAERLYRQARAERWRVPQAAFTAALETSCAKAFPAEGAAPREVSRYLSSLHLEDLALACACALGDSAAWDHFVLEMRPGLYRAADALDPIGCRARAGRLALRRPLRRRPARRHASVAVAVLSRPQQPRHVAARRARAAPCRSRARRSPHRAAAGRAAGPRLAGSGRPRLRSLRGDAAFCARDRRGAARAARSIAPAAATTRSS